MKSPNTRRRVAALSAVTAVGAVTTLVSGVTLALFSSTGTPQTNKFTAGAVTLTESATMTCSYANSNGTQTAVNTDTLTASSPTVTGASGLTPNAFVGWYIKDTTTGHTAYIPTATVVTGNTATTITLANAATTAASNDALVLTPPIGINPGDSSTGYTNGSGTNTGQQCSVPYSYSGSYAWLAVDVSYSQSSGIPTAPYGSTDTSGATNGTTAITDSVLFTTANQYNNWGISDTAGAIPTGDHIATNTSSGAATLVTAASSSQTNDTFVLTPPAANLVDGTTNGLELLLKDTGSGTTLINNTTYNKDGTAGTTVPSGASNSIKDFLISASSKSTTSQTGTVTLDWYLPNNAGNPGLDNAYQSAVTTVTLTVHAVQADSNPSPDTNSAASTAPAPCAVGVACGTEIPSWS